MPASEYSAIALVVDGTTDVDAATVNQYYRLLKGTITGDAITPAGPVRITVANATGLAVGPNGVTNPSFQVDSSAASAATGIVITAAAAASRVALAALSSGANEGLSIDAKGSGTIRLGATSTGAIEFSRAAQPTTNDGVALGVGGTAWADLFLASAAVINFANGDVTLTHATGLLTIDLTGAATRTLTLTNSTGSQVANLDVDGRLLFRNNTSFTITLSGTPTAARVFTFPDVADDTVTLLAAIQTFLTGVKTFNSSILAIRNPADTYSYTIAGAAILANRVLTLPLATGADTLAALGVAQTWTALQSFGTNLGGTLQTAAQANVTSLGTLTGLTIAGNLTFSAAARDIIVPATTAAALEISDGTIKLMTFNSQTAVGGTTTVVIDTPDQTIASAANAWRNALFLDAYWVNLTGNTQVTQQLTMVQLGIVTIAADGVGGACTVDAAAGLYVGAPTEGANVTLTETRAIHIANTGGTPINQVGINIAALSGATTRNDAIHVRGANPIRLGTATSATGLLIFEGLTSGSVTITVGSVAGTWTMELPAAVPGTNGDQLSALTTGVCSWTAAGSLREFKNFIVDALGVPVLLNPKTALQRIIAVPIEMWRYDKNAKSSTGDFETVYAAVVADKAPWAMHHEGRIFDPASAFGHAAAAIQALHSDLQDALAEIAGLKAQVAALQA